MAKGDFLRLHSINRYQRRLDLRYPQDQLEVLSRFFPDAESQFVKAQTNLEKVALCGHYHDMEGLVVSVTPKFVLDQVGDSCGGYAAVLNHLIGLIDASGYRIINWQDHFMTILQRNSSTVAAIEKVSIDQDCGIIIFPARLREMEKIKRRGNGVSHSPNREFNLGLCEVLSVILTHLHFLPSGLSQWLNSFGFNVDCRGDFFPSHIPEKRLLRVRQRTEQIFPSIHIDEDGGINICADFSRAPSDSFCQAIGVIPGA